MTPSAYKVALVDDQKLSLDRFADLLSYFDNFQLIWKANSAREALAKFKNAAPDLFLLDLEMPNINGVELCSKLRSANFKGKILMLSISNTDQHLKQALQAGADGYLLKGERPETLVRMMKESMEGRMAFSAEMAQKTMNMVRRPLNEHLSSPEDYQISKREGEVLKLLIEGKTYTNIADELVISPLTVRSHMENIYRKLEVHNKAGAINLALKNRWF